MSTSRHTLASGGTIVPPAGRRALFTVFLATFGIVALIWSEIWLSAAAGIWAFVHLLDLGQIGYYVLSLLLVPPALWASWQTARLAWIGVRDGGS